MPAPDRVEVRIDAVLLGAHQRQAVEVIAEFLVAARVRRAVAEAVEAVAFFVELIVARIVVVRTQNLERVVFVVCSAIFDGLRVGGDAIDQQFTILVDIVD